MTPEELEKLIKAGNVANLVAALTPLTEPNRKKLAKTAAALLKDTRQNERNIWTQMIAAAKSISITSNSMDRLWLPQKIAGLAVLGLCGWTDAKRVRIERSFSQVDDTLERVLRARKPDWIDKWIDRMLNEEWCDWATIRCLVRDRICAEPASPLYISWMVRTAAGHFGSGISLHDKLREDRGLLEKEIWKMFDTDFGNDIVFSPGEFEHHRHSWGLSLVQLSQTGDINRSRLLTATLDALNRKQHATNASWFCKLHEALMPSSEERIERQRKYIDLLVNSVPAVVGFAADALREIPPARLDAAKIADNLNAALALRQKGHAMGAAKLLRLCAKQGVSSDRIARAAAAGLEHAAIEIQQACIALLEEFGIGNANETLAARADAIAASLRPRLDALLGTAASAPSAPAVNSDDIIAEACAIPEPWRTLAGIDPLLQLLQQNTATRLPPLSFNPLAVPRLDPAKTITPIATFDELLEGLYAGIEDGGGPQAGTLHDAEQFERLLDGLSRFADHRPADFAARTAPLLKRIDDMLGDKSGAFFPGTIRSRLQLLIRTWIREETIPASTGNIRLTIAEYFAARMAALSMRLKSHTAGPLLAFPTHAGGWIDALQCVDRLLFWQTQRRLEMSDPMDLTQALLRLAPDHRPEALAAAATLHGEAGAAVRFALGASESFGTTKGLWIAAARARDSLAEFPALAEKFGDLGPDAAFPAHYTWEFYKPTHYTPTARGLAINVLPPRQTQLDCPTVLLHLNQLSFWAMGSILEIRCQTQVWPANPDATLAHGASMIEQRLNSPASALSPTAQYLEPLLDPDVPLTPMADLVLAMGLLSKDAGTKGMTLDVLLAAISDGRCTGHELGELLARLSQIPDLVRLNRIAEGLIQITRAGPLHQHVAATLIESFLATHAALHFEPPADLHHLLTPLREYFTTLHSGPTPKTRALLQEISTGGKTATLIKSLLTLLTPSAVNPQVLFASLQSRLTRAHRWMSR